MSHVDRQGSIPVRGGTCEKVLRPSKKSGVARGGERVGKWQDVMTEG